tara:strand:+ start:421 stop:930 length:510 start_codon:yes stop_codon:yes gene_type:complete
MPEYILPTLSITTNSDTATNNPGPSSWSFSGSIVPLDSGRITIDGIRGGHVAAGGALTPSGATRLSALSTTVQLLVDGSEEDDATGVAGANGGFLYLKNTSAADYDVYLGIEAHATSPVTELEGDADAQRLMTLKKGEFAWFPIDYTMNITIDAEHNDATAEFFLFNRG